MTRLAALVGISSGLLVAGQLAKEGNPASAVKVIIYEDLQCSDCAVFRQMMDRDLLAKYGAKVSFEHRDFPLAKHAWARKAAFAARYFESVKPELGIEWRRYIMAHQKETRPDNLNGQIMAFARENQVDPEKAVASADSTQFAEAVENDVKDGVARGVVKTPTVFVDGQPFVETFTLEEISKALDTAVKSGT